MQESPLPHLGKDEEIEEVHESQNQQYPADFGAQRFQYTLQVGRFVVRFERQRDEAEVDQVKADEEQMIDRIGEGLVPEETIDEKNASVLMQRLRHPDGEQDADEQIGDVGPDGGCHRCGFFPLFIFCIFRKY